MHIPCLSETAHKNSKQKQIKEQTKAEKKELDPETKPRVNMDVVWCGALGQLRGFTSDAQICSTGKFSHLFF